MIPGAQDVRFIDTHPIKRQQTTLNEFNEVGMNDGTKQKCMAEA